MDTIIRILEDSPTITGHYDQDADVLYLSLGQSLPTLTVELGEGVIARYDEKSQAIVGITVIGLRERVQQELNSKLHVAPHAAGWAVIQDAIQENVKVFPTQEAAINWAMEIARNQWLEVVIHRENGEIQELINPAMDALLLRRKER